MICPYCDSVLNGISNTATCPNCGAKLPTYVELEEKRHINGRFLEFPEPPIGIYKDAAGYLKIDRDGVTFFRRQFIKRHKRVIPFHEIYAVSYGPGAFMQSGFLCVREWKDRNLPLATESLAIITDETSVYFPCSKNNAFRKVYEFLKVCAAIVHAANPDWPENGLLPLMGKYKGFYGYMELGPDSVTFSKKVLFQKRTVRIIPYGEIYDVMFKEAKGTNTGGLLVRERKDITVPTRGPDYAAVEETAIDFDRWHNERMKQVYEFLKQCAEENRCTPAEPEKTGTEVCCPICCSISVTVKRIHRPFPHYIGSINNAKMRAANRGLWLVLTCADAITNGAVNCTCLNCGHRWKEKKSK